MLIPLICSQCGGKLEVENSQVFESGDTMVVLAGQTFKCPHCGTKYLPGEKISHATEKGGIFIGGGVSGSTIVIGNGLVVNYSPEIPEDDEETEEHDSENPQAEPPKKWWQFWKA